MQADELKQLATWFQKNVLELSGDDESDTISVADDMVSSDANFTHYDVDEEELATLASDDHDIRFAVEHVSAIDRKEEERSLFEYIVGIDNM